MLGATLRLLCNSFLVMLCFLTEDIYHLPPKKELHRSLQVAVPKAEDPG